MQTADLFHDVNDWISQIHSELEWYVRQLEASRVVLQIQA